ncbi:MAG: SUMF1/EgtB/PvdO family nonheme iron enzyme [Planctomycetota bacterium]
MAVIRNLLTSLFFIGLLCAACSKLETAGPLERRLGEHLERLESMVFIDAGEVSSELVFLEEEGGPERSGVVQRPFFLDRFEVTNRAYATFLEATRYRGLGPGFLEHWTRVNGEPQSPENLEDQPVVWVSFADAVAFATWRGHRLPRFIEWQLAVRGKSGQAFPWGRSTDITVRANVLGTGLHQPSPVGFFESGRSEAGCYDLTGNVWEWSETKGPRPGTQVQVGGAFDTPGLKVASASIPTPGLPPDLWTQDAASRSFDRGFRTCFDAEELLSRVIADVAKAPDSVVARKVIESLARLPEPGRALVTRLAAEQGQGTSWFEELQG